MQNSKDKEDSQAESQPPAYSELPQYPASSSSRNAPADDAKKQIKGCHHKVTMQDTLPGLALKYNTTLAALRTANNLNHDQDLIARNTIFIPGSDAQSQPMTEEEEQKMLIKRFQINTKCLDYYEAKSYLVTHDWDLVRAAEALQSDLEWERRQPQVGGSSKDKGKRV